MLYWLLLLGLIYIGLPYIYVKKGINRSVLFLYVVSVLVFFPALQGKGGVPLLSDCIFTAQLFVLNVGYGDLIELISGCSSQYVGLFAVCAWSVFVLCPILTVQIILNYLSDTVKKLLLRIHPGQRVYVFNEANENALLLARDIHAKEKKTTILFVQDCGKEFLWLDTSLEQIYRTLHRKSVVKFFLISENDAKNIDDTVALLHGKKEVRDELFLFSREKITSDIADYLKKDAPRAVLRVIDPQRMQIQKILWDAPLYTYQKSPEELNVTVLGVGSLGAEFAANVLWCGQLPDCQLKLNLVDMADREQILRRVSENLVEADYDLEVHPENADTNQLLTHIENTRMIDSDYFFIAFRDDAMNIKIARELRLFFERKNLHPYILAAVRHDGKFKVMQQVLQEEDITLTGSVGEIYCADLLVEDECLKRALRVFRVVEEKYGHPDSTILDFFRQRQVDIYSSYAHAIHTKYKLNAVAGNPETKTREELEKAVCDNLHKLNKAEHDRWMVFEKLKGYRGIPKEEWLSFMQSNKASGKIHKNDRLKLHACITDYESLAELDALREAEFGEKTRLKQLDEDLVRETVSFYLDI